jgi:hypothetical protein
MSNVIPFPPHRPPFLEIVTERFEDCNYAVKYRDQHYRAMVIWRSRDHKSSAERAAAQAPAFGMPVIDLARRR